MNSETVLPSVAAHLMAVEPVLSGWVNVTRVEVLMPDGAVVERHVEDHGSGVTVLPYDRDRKVAMLITQPRAPVLLAGGGMLLETIAGRLDGADPELRLRKEALEEGGVELGELELVVRAWMIPSISTERLHLYLAPYDLTSRIGLGGGCDAEHENIVVKEIPLRELAQKAALGEITDAKTLILILALQVRQPDLFAYSVESVEQDCFTTAKCVQPRS